VVSLAALVLLAQRLGLASSAVGARLEHGAQEAADACLATIG
jgi:hypothetical protein